MSSSTLTAYATHMTRMITMCEDINPPRKDVWRKLLQARDILDAQTIPTEGRAIRWVEADGIHELTADTHYLYGEEDR